MKKWLILLVGVLTLSFVLAGCGNTGATYNYDLTKYVTLGQYKGIEVSTEEIETQMQEQIDSVLSNNSTEETLTDGSVENGNVVNISYTGTIDGEVFDGGSATEYDLTVGSGSFIDGFEEGLIGKAVGDTVELDLQFPEDYTPNPDLSGTDVHFSVVIHSRTITVIPEYTDEFIAGIEGSIYATTEEYEVALRENIKENLVWNALLDSCTVLQYPESETKYYYNSMVDQYEYMAMYQYGTSFESFITSYMGTDYDTFLASLLSTAKLQVEKDLVTYAIANVENIKAAGSDYDEIALEYAVNNGYETVDEYKDAYGKVEVDRSVLLHRIVQMITDNSVEI